WDNPTCTRNVVVVSRGMRAMMSCEIANNFAQVNVSLCKPKQNCSQILGVKAPGSLTKEGWHLQVQGRVATLVIEDAQATHAGEYTWNLEGLQDNYIVTVLDVPVEDNPNCTGNVVVYRGMPAEMSCKIENNFSQVNVSLCKPEQNCSQILGVKAPGSLTKEGWHLQVQDRVATLVIEDAQATHAGEYTWKLKGLQDNYRVTVLNVS
ncbi:PREDICTED: secreted and transmembrane protein 1A-like, partial [Chrysochloris asiatica]|uniref:Secreted and transmembrane protein 1A-like n=1 Tax=Chrysochloris asiatica TaxID=185453 RepID=A0A9B0X3A3_CHRAS